MNIIDSIIHRLEPPDIRRVYRLHRQLVSIAVHGAARANDGHFDRTLYAGSDGRAIPIRVYPPRSIHPQCRIILFFHGGGWVIDDVNRYHRTCRSLAEMTGSYVISVDYRRAPEHKFPAGLKDCYEAARQVFAAAARRGISHKHIVLAGDSAGGNLAAAVSLLALKRKEFKVMRQVLIYPVTACEYGEDSPYASTREKGSGYLLTTERMRGYMELYLNDPAQKDNPYVAPIKAKSFAGYPDTLVITAENDPLRDEGEAFAEKLYRSGNPVMAFRIKNAYHGFFAFDPESNPYGAKAVSMIMYFLRLTD